MPAALNRRLSDRGFLGCDCTLHTLTLLSGDYTASRVSGLSVILRWIVMVVGHFSLLVNTVLAIP